MKYRLQRNEKEAIIGKYSDNKYYSYLKYACKKFERYLNNIRLSPEEIFLESIAFIDDIREKPSEAMNYARILWDSLYCDLRELAPENTEEKELDDAVAVIVYAIILFLNAIDLFHVYNSVMSELMRQYIEKARERPELNSIESVYRTQTNRTDINSLIKEAKEYVSGDSFITDEIGLLLNHLSLPPSETGKVAAVEVDNMTSNKSNRAKQSEPSVKIANRMKSRVEVVLTAMFRAGYLEPTDGKKSIDAKVKVLIKQLFGAEAKNLQQDRSGLSRYGEVDTIFTELRDAYKNYNKK